MLQIFLYKNIINRKIFPKVCAYYSLYLLKSLLLCFTKFQNSTHQQYLPRHSLMMLFIMDYGKDNQYCQEGKWY